MYKQYIEIQIKIAEMEARRESIDLELKLLMGEERRKYKSPTFDGIITQGSPYKMSDIEEINKIAILSAERSILESNIKNANNCKNTIYNILCKLINNIGINNSSIEYIILRDYYMSNEKKTLQEIADETGYSCGWIKKIKSKTVDKKIAMLRGERK